MQKMSMFIQYAIGISIVINNLQWINVHLRLTIELMFNSRNIPCYFFFLLTTVNASLQIITLVLCTTFTLPHRYAHTPTHTDTQITPINTYRHTRTCYSNRQMQTYRHSFLFRNSYANGTKALAFLPTSCACTLGNRSMKI